MTADRHERALIERSWHELVERGALGSAAAAGSAAEASDAAAVVRDEVRASWARSAHSITPAIDHAPIHDDAPAAWRTSRMARAFRAVADELDQAGVDGDLVSAATDADGTIVWTGGGPSMRRRAEKVAFVPGGRWDEASVGTNALALALRTGRPATVWSAEHYAPIVHDWVCYSAPIVDPRTGATVGVLDLSTTWDRQAPLAARAVGALARLMGLALEPGSQPRPGASPSPVRELTLHALGGAEVLADGTPLVLPPRQVELLAVLALAPDGLTLEQLHDRLHGERGGSPSTTKAELSHLRRDVGVPIASRPYRLAVPVRADLVEVLDRLAAGDLDGALDLYRGPVLVRSRAPAIEEHRAAVDVAVRAAVLADGDPDRLARLSERMPDDGYVHEQARDHLPAGDPRRALAEARLARLG